MSGPAYPSWNDSPSDSWAKISRNFYEAAKSSGFSGLEPDAGDDEVTSQKKTVIYTAYLAENS